MSSPCRLSLPFSTKRTGGDWYVNGLCALPPLRLLCFRCLASEEVLDSSTTDPAFELDGQRHLSFHGPGNREALGVFDGHT